MSDIAIKLEDISKFYKLYNSPKDRLKEALHPFGKKLHREFYALKHINLEVKKGEILGIVGKNGAGKSTLLKLISMVVQPSSGQIIVNGSVSALLELGSGLHPDFTGIQNIYFNGTMMGFSREEMGKKVEGIVSFADIGDFINQPLRTYSSGMKARLGFALAVSIDPKILIVDEVLAVGDELFRRKCYARMEQLFQSGCTVLFVSHAADSINTICTRAILLDAGEQILEGPPKMVTMYYQKLLFANQQDTLKVREEIFSLNKSEEEKKKFAAEVKSDKEEKQIETGKKEKQEAFFIPGLMPKSNVTYKNRDVEILDIHIRTLDGRKVNALVMGEEYTFSYNVIFNENFREVNLTMSFKTLKGVKISGARLLKTDKRINVITGDKYRVEWTFTCNLLPQTYFASLGVSCSINKKQVILNAIGDAFAFKVLTVPDLLYTGLVHLNQELKVHKLN